MPVDAQQLAELIETHAGALRLWIRSRCASCEDVVQEAFCQLARQDPPPDNPAAWLYRVCRNLAEKQRISDGRRRKREQTWAEAKSAVNPEESDSLAEALAAVQTLDDEQREVLIARLWGRLTLEQVAELCGISTATAFRRYAAALQSLRVKLSQDCEQRP